MTQTLVCALALLAQDYRVKAPAPRAPSIESTLSKTDAALDTWTGEQSYERFNAHFGRISTAMKAGRNTIPVLAPTFSRFAKLEVAEFKIIGIQDNKARLRVELAGLARSGDRISFVAPASAEFSGDTLKDFRVDPWHSSSAKAPLFADVSEKALGRNDSYQRQLRQPLDHWRRHMDEATGIDVYGHNGVAAGDYNNDGFEDLYFAQPSGLPNRLYRNNGNGTFSDVSRATGTDLLDATSMSLFADIDNDGDQDLIVITASQPLLLRNTNTRFTIERNTGFTPTNATLTGAALADYDRDGDLDLYVCAYAFWSAGEHYAAPAPYYDANNGPPNFLYRNRGDGTFEDVTASAGLTHRRYSFAAAWADYDRDGWPDLAVANDFGRKNLYRNLGNGRFEDVAAKLGVDDLGAGMSAAWSDADANGFPDLYFANMWSSAGQRLTQQSAFKDVAPDAGIRNAFQQQARGNSLFLNQGGTFTNTSASVEFGRWAWSSDFFDADNDGHEDLYVMNGYVTGPDTHDL